MQIAAKLAASIDLTEILQTADSPFVSSSTNKVLFNGLNQLLNLSNASTPAITKFAVLEQVITAGVATIDLTACPGGPGGSVVNATGLRLIAYLIVGEAGNGAAISVAVGASNGYQLDGGAYHRTLTPKGFDLGYSFSSAPLIDSTHKNIDLAGTGSSDKLGIIFIFG